MISKEAIGLIRKAKYDYEQALDKKMGAAVAKQRFVNILLSHADELADTAEEAIDLYKKYTAEKGKVAELTRQMKDVSESKDGESGGASPKDKKRE